MTWSFMRNYVTTFCVTISSHPAIAILPAFGPVENYELDSFFELIFSKRFRMQLSAFIVESARALISEKSPCSMRSLSVFVFVTFWRH
jgi:hypothetical protein